MSVNEPTENCRHLCGTESECSETRAALAAALLRAEQALTREGEMFAQATERMLQANDLHVALTAAESRAEVLADALREATQPVTHTGSALSPAYSPQGKESGS